MEDLDVAKLKAPKKLKLTKPRPRKDANQNNITEKILPINGERIFVPKPPVHSDLLDENFDMRGDSFDTWSSTSESSNGTTDLVNANTRPLSRKSENEIYSTLSRRNSEASSVCSGSEDLNVDAGIEVSKMRAPRKTKLNKPRPLKTSRSDENGNVNSELRSNKDTNGDVTKKITEYLNELKQGNLSINECLELRDLLAVHCPHLEMINREYIDNCFQDIKEVLNEKKVQDKLVLVSLRDLVALRQRSWQPYPVPPSSRKKSVTWNDITNDIIYTDKNNGNSTSASLIKPQLSVDSGIDVGYPEEALEEDISTEILSTCQNHENGKKERSPSPQSVIEAVKGLKIVGEDEEFVKAAAELLQKYLKKKNMNESKEDINKTNMNRQGKLMNNVIRQPIGPGTSKEFIEEVEKTLPSGRNTAKGRRAMFKSYNSVISPRIEESSSDATITSHTYTRDELLYLAKSKFSRVSPPEMSYLSKVFPDICYCQTEQYFRLCDLTLGTSERCPVVPTKSYDRHDRSSVESDCDSVNSDRPSFRRGFSYPGKPFSIAETGKPTLRRGFSCPTGDMYKADSSDVKIFSGGFGRRSSVDEDIYTGNGKLNNDFHHDNNTEVWD